MSGLVIVVLGAWGGLIPFVGPYFDFSFFPDATWHYTMDRLWLSILPGGVAVLGGLLIIYAGHRVSGSLGGWIAAAAGAWFAVGPAVSGLWQSTVGIAGPIGVPLGGAHRQVLEQIGYFYGVGVLIVGFAAFALGRFVSRNAWGFRRPEPTTIVKAFPHRDQPVEQPTGDQPAVQPTGEQPAGEQQPDADEQPTTVS